jgi:hypothetical protein
METLKENIYKALEKKFKDQLAMDKSIEWKDLMPQKIAKSKVQLDAYGENEKGIHIAEIYITIGAAKAGKRRKVMSDCMKMLYAEKLMEKNNKTVHKYFVTVDDTALADRGKSWVKEMKRTWQCKAIMALGIDIILYEIEQEQDYIDLQNAINENRKQVKNRTEI